MKIVSPNRRHWLLGLKIVLSLGLLAWLLSRLSLPQLVSITLRLSLGTAAGFFLAMSGASLLNAWKWQLLLKAWRIDLPYPFLFKQILVGFFFTKLLPGGFGGDAFRLYASGRTSGQVPGALAVLFYDRLLAFSALIVLGLGAMLTHNWGADWLWGFFAFAAVAMLFMLGLAMLPWAGQGARWLEHWSRWPKHWRLAVWFESLHTRPDQAMALVAALLIAVLMQTIMVFTYYLIAVNLQLPLRMADLFLFVPMLYLAVAVPISINGLGIRETAFVLFFGRLGFQPAEAFSFSFAHSALLTAFSLLGGLIYMVDRNL